MSPALRRWLTRARLLLVIGYQAGRIRVLDWLIERARRREERGRRSRI